VLDCDLPPTIILFKLSFINLILPFFPAASLMSVFSCVSLSHRLEFLPSGAYLSSYTDYPHSSLSNHLLQPYWLTPYYWDIFTAHTLPYIISVFWGYRLFLVSLNPEDRTDRLPETSVRNYQHTSHNNPEEHSSQLSRKIVVCKPMAFERIFF